MLNRLDIAIATTCCGVGFWLIAAGCVPQDRQPVRGKTKAADTGYQVGVDATLLEEGRQTYAIYCVGCHGENGDGKGPAAAVMHPKPRDFTNAKFKFSSRRNGDLPTDRNLFDTITNGLKGTAMPPWKLLPERQRWSLVAYLKTFSDKWELYDVAPVIPVVEDPYAASPDKSEAIARGAAVYHGLAQCWTCHPAYAARDRINAYHEAMGLPRREFFRENLDNAVARISTDDSVVFVPDFRRDLLRAGTSVEVLYRSIAAGITGTAMPTWVDSIETQSNAGDQITTRGDLWALAYYVQSLTEQRPPLLAAADITIRDREMIVSQDDWVAKIGDSLRSEMGGDDDEEEEEEEEE